MSLSYGGPSADVNTVLLCLKSGLAVSIALCAWHVEAYGAYPEFSLVLLHRISRVRRITTILTFIQEHDLIARFSVGRTKIMDGDASVDYKGPARRNIDSADVGRTFASGGPNNFIKPSPTGHIGSPTHSAASATLTNASMSMEVGDTAAGSAADPPKSAKRVSLSFPNGLSRPPSWAASPAPSPVINQSPTGGSFLTALAAKERRVLELKEELSKAEHDLEMLKRQWATHESTKKRNDVRSVHQLQPLNTAFANVVPPEDDADGSSMWMQREMDRRRALLSGTKTSNRKVFSGSRHTRTLSLLSPDKMGGAPSFPPIGDVKGPEDSPIRRPLVRSATVSDFPERGGRDDMFEFGPTQKDALIRTGRQMATDLKDGLLTFIEDLRQATVGDEAVHGPQSKDGAQNVRRQVSRGSLAHKRSNTTNSVLKKTHPSDNDKSALVDVGGSFWKENGVDESVKSTPAKAMPAQAGSKTPRRPLRKAVDDSGESWETWDTPDRAHTASSTDGSDSDGRTSPSSPRSSPRTSTRYV